jgi:hypothetical protein
VANTVWWIVIVAVIASVILYALVRKGDVSASMSLGKLLEFKLDAKEKRGPEANR